MRKINRSIIPNTFTLCNIISGFIAITYISNNLFHYGMLWIIIAAFFDMMDGFVARLTKSTSEFGVQLDSLCDAVSFGLAPAYMLYKAYFFEFGFAGVLLSALPAVGGVLRLARFNVKKKEFAMDKDFFIGFPIPSSAILISSYVVFFHQSPIWDNPEWIESVLMLPEYFKPATIVFVTIAVSLAMVSNIHYTNLPGPTIKQFKRKPITAFLFYTGIILSILTSGLFVFPLMIIFLVGGALRHYYIKYFVAHGG